MSIPFVEKYRPKNINDIILDDVNKIIITNIIKNKTYPNLLLYGPPGTGKTTTIINLVNHIQKDNNKSLLLHLNASDERGIDTIRNQITKFINSKPLFSKGIKFIILDEVDYMTKSAQQALKFVLQQYNNKAVFCLMCNYISKIDNSLKCEFIELKFNKLPREDIIKFLKYIINKENINLTENQLIHIQIKFQSDIRSMINYIQSNYISNNINIITSEEILHLFSKLSKSKSNKQILYTFCETYNITPKECFLQYFKLLFKENKINNSDIIKQIELAIHDYNYNIYESEYLLNLFSIINNSSC
jgi:replication factor C subunit 3/5